MLLPSGVNVWVFYHSRDDFTLKLVQSLDASVYKLLALAPSFHSVVPIGNISKS